EKTALNILVKSGGRDFTMSGDANMQIKERITRALIAAALSKTIPRSRRNLSNPRQKTPIRKNTIVGMPNTAMITVLMGHTGWLTNAIRFTSKKKNPEITSAMMPKTFLTALDIGR